MKGEKNFSFFVVLSSAIGKSNFLASPKFDGPGKVVPEIRTRTDSINHARGQLRQTTHYRVPKKSLITRKTLHTPRCPNPIPTLTLYTE